MRTIKIETPNNEEGKLLIDKISGLATKHDLRYSIFGRPNIKIIDMFSKEVIYESNGMLECFISGNELSIDKFLSEVRIDYLLL